MHIGLVTYLRSLKKRDIFLRSGAVLRLFRKKIPKATGTAGFCERQGGVGMALVERLEGMPPRLALCDFAFCENDGGRGRAMAAMAERHGLTQTPCVGTMDFGSYELLLVEQPGAAGGEIGESLRWQIKDLISFPVEEAIIDLFEVPTRGPDNVAYVAVAPYGEVLKQVERFHGAKLNLFAVDIPELALRNLVELHPANEKGVGVLLFGPRQGVILVIKGSEVRFSRTIRTGFLELYECIAERDVSASGEGAGSYEALDNIALEIQRTFDFYESSSAQPPINTLLVAPTERPMPELVSHLDASLAASASLLDIDNLFEGGEPIAPDMQARCLMAIGAALRDEGAAS